jgi:hypothetical protein
MLIDGSNSVEDEESRDGVSESSSGGGGGASSRSSSSGLVTRCVKRDLAWCQKRPSIVYTVDVVFVRLLTPARACTRAYTRTHNPAGTGCSIMCTASARIVDRMCSL